MGSKVIRNVTKILKATSGRLFGRVTSGTGRGEELSPSTARTLLSVYSTSQVDTALTSKADLVGGVIPTAQIPAIAITEYLGSVASQVSMLALDGDRGDWCLRSDLGTTWVLADDDSTLLASWVELNYPTAPVTSVAGRTGTVTLSNTDISGLGSLATQSGTFSGTSSGTNTGDQSLFSTIAVSGQSNVVADQTGDTLTLVGGTNITITTDASTDTITITNTASGLSGTGSTDNAVLRADGTGGSTLQASAIVIDDLFTASPNNTVNVVCLKPTGGTTNVGVAIVPKGTGSFSLAVPDGTATGGNARGANSVDLQTSRALAANIASGQYAGLGGYNSKATARCAFGWGYEVEATGVDSTAFGLRCYSSGASAFSHNINCGATGSYSHASGLNALADRVTMRAHSGGIFSADGDAQYVRFNLRCKTTNSTPTSMYIWTSTRLTIPSGKILFADVLVAGIKSDGSASACYKRKVAIKNVGGTTALVGTVETLGTDIEDNASTDVVITADDTNDALQISVTGITAETWRWVAVVEGLEIAYGT